MAAKKPAAKATKAKKTVAKKAAPVKKSAPARKSAASARSKPAPARPAVKSVAKPATKTPKPKPKAIPTPVPKEVAAAAPKPAEKIPTAPRAQMPARPVVNRPLDIDQNTANELDDSDGQEISGLNLLAGPRNVKPYVARRGEQYMSKEQLDHFRNILETWKRDLMQEVDRTVLHMKDEAANFPDPNDRATQESEFSLELRTRDRERKLIRKIEEAIKRIDDGSYGYCVETGEEIGVKRLEARPVATLSLEAQERRERREKQYGDRDDRYR